ATLRAIQGDGSLSDSLLNLQKELYTPNDANNEIKKLSESIYLVTYDYLHTEGCLALIQYDHKKIKVLKMSDEEIDKITFNKFIKKSDK
ncbi:MAG: hypothetical protein RRY13_06810, partial [Akkermansia sp.]